MNGDGMTAPADEAGSLRARTILVVEDEVLLRLAIAEHLRAAGHRVIEASNAEEAMRVIGADTSVGLVFTDVNMTGAMDGLTLARWIGRTHPGIRLLVTSGLATTAGDTPFVAKPYRFDEIERLVGSLLGP